jgi:hypothetical protein
MTDDSDDLECMAGVDGGCAAVEPAGCNDRIFSEKELVQREAGEGESKRQLLEQVTGDDAMVVVDPAKTVVGRDDCVGLPPEI